MEKFKVTFYPDEKTVEVPKNTTILSAALTAGVYINSTCAGDGVCGRCKVIVKKGDVVTLPTGRITLQERNQNVYLACLTSIHGDLEVEIPADSRLDTATKDSDLRLNGVYALAEEIEPAPKVPVKSIFARLPQVTKLYLELIRPTLGDRISDLERLYRHIRLIKNIPVIQTGLSNIRRLPGLLRSSEWKVTVALGERESNAEVIFIEPGDTSNRNFGVAFDIGTTTISGQLVDLNSQKILGTKATYNKQASFGSDVITRIVYARYAEGLEKLHHAVIDSMNNIVHELISEHSIDLNDITCMVCAGNTTMIHLLMRIDPTYIRREPYIPAASFMPVIRASEVGMKINPRGLLSCVPSVASYIGADVIAGILSSGIYRQEELSVLIDIGTNGEIVLGNREFLIATSASAGPAFEGSGVISGMRSSKGAIFKVDFDSAGAPTYETVGQQSPRGLCGSGYIDAIAGMLKAGILDRDGKFKEHGDNRIREGSYGREFVLVSGENTGIKSDIVITEIDIENIKRAKAAIYAALRTLLKHVNFEIPDIKKFFIAGGFGTYIDISNAICIGLLPDVDKSRFVFIGNSALAGSRLALLSAEAMFKTKEIAQKTTYLELSVDPGYMDEYTAALFFPHTDVSRFPNVRYGS